jgi:transposase-like protein
MPKPTTELPATEVAPNPRSEKRTRRIFTRDYKLSILHQAQACQHGELGALLRREKLYSNQLSQWRRELEQGGLEALAKSAPGPKAQFTPEQKKIAALEKEISRLKQLIAVKDNCIELQKKVLAIIEQLESGNTP